MPANEVPFERRERLVRPTNRHPPTPCEWAHSSGVESCNLLVVHDVDGCVQLCAQLYSYVHSCRWRARARRDEVSVVKQKRPLGACHGCHRVLCSRQLAAGLTGSRTWETVADEGTQAFVGLAARRWNAGAGARAVGLS